MEWLLPMQSGGRLLISQNLDRGTYVDSHSFRFKVEM